MEAFIGFSFNNIHSSSLGIKRITKEGLYSQPLSPTSQDKTEETISTDGAVYLGTTYTGFNITINYYFGPVNESGFQALKTFCETKKVAPLIFDESLYKIYSAKITGSAISYYNIYGAEGERIYYGTGELV